MTDTFSFSVQNNSADEKQDRSGRIHRHRFRLTGHSSHSDQRNDQSGRFVGGSSSDDSRMRFLEKSSQSRTTDIYLFIRQRQRNQVISIFLINFLIFNFFVLAYKRLLIFRAFRRRSNLSRCVHLKCRGMNFFASHFVF